MSNIEKNTIKLNGLIVFFTSRIATYLAYWYNVNT